MDDVLDGESLENLYSVGDLYVRRSHRRARFFAFTVAVASGNGCLLLPLLSSPRQTKVHPSIEHRTRVSYVLQCRR